MKLRVGRETVGLKPGAPLIMGIVNVGDDSVADSRELRTLDAQLELALRLHGDGAHIVDVGVQSGRTDTPVLSEQEEIERLVPLVSALAGERVAVSVDTWRARVVKAALEAGASMINDVSGLADAQVAGLAAASGAGLVIMHTRAAPKTERFPGYRDPMADVMSFLQERIGLALRQGVGRDQIVVDPGLDFAKTPRESIAVLRRLQEMGRLGRPVLLAVSRKYFIGMITGRGPNDRLAGTLAAVGFGVDAGAQIVRVHDVAETAEFLRLRRTLCEDGDPQLRGDPGEEALKWLPPRRRRGAAGGRDGSARELGCEGVDDHRAEDDHEDAQRPQG